MKRFFSSDSMKERALEFGLILLFTTGIIVAIFVI